MWENCFLYDPVERRPQNPAPEGRPNLAQRFSAGKSGKNNSSPGDGPVLTHSPNGIPCSSQAPASRLTVTGYRTKTQRLSSLSRCDTVTTKDHTFVPTITGSSVVA